MKKRLMPILLVLSMLMLFACNRNGTPNRNEGETGTGENTEPETLLTLFDGSENDYAIIYSPQATDCVSEAVTALRGAVTERTGKKPVTAPDNSKKQPETEREIVIGATTRAVSASETEKIEGYGWRIAFVGKKLVVSASNDILLAEAIERLMGTWISEGTTVSLSNRTLLTEDATAAVYPLTDNGKARYRVIIPAKCTDAVRDKATQVANALAKASGGSMGTVHTDSEIAEKDGAYEICIGRTTRAASTKLYAELRGLFEAKAVIDGTRIVVGGLREETLLTVMGTLCGIIEKAVQGAYRGGAVLSADWTTSENPESAASCLPAITAGKVKGSFDTGKDAYILYATGIVLTDYTAYIKTLVADGCREEAAYKLGDNRYALLKHEKYTAYVSYLPQKNAMRVYVGGPDVPNPAPEAESFETVCEPTLWQLDVDNYGSKANGGMSYVMQLPDGTFLVVDGGYSTETEARNLYSHLMAHTPTGQKPVISAWFITHGHIDHYGALMNFSGRYSDAVEVKAFYYNLPYISVGDIGAHNSKAIEAAMSRWQTAKRYSALHSGMQFGLAGAEVTVLCSFEDVYPLTIENGNDTSLVFRVDIGGQRILFTGDAQTAESVTMTGTIPREALKCDIVQFSHHGYEGCEPAFYNMADASVVLWPMNIVGYQPSGYASVPQRVFAKWYNGSLAANRFIREQVEKGKIKKLFCMGDGTVELKLPYTPTGRVVPDYDKIYGQTARKE